MDCNPAGSSVHGISQTRILERVAIPFSRGPHCRQIVYRLSHQGSPMNKVYLCFTLCTLKNVIVLQSIPTTFQRICFTNFSFSSMIYLHPQNISVIASFIPPSRKYSRWEKTGNLMNLCCQIKYENILSLARISISLLFCTLVGFTTQGCFYITVMFTIWVKSFICLFIVYLFFYF